MFKDIFVMAILTHLDCVENAPSLQKFLSIERKVPADMQVKTVSEKIGGFLLPSGQQ